MNYTFPGVYVEEIPSSVRTITGVSTSTTGFIGRAVKGPVNKPVVLNSFGDFEKRFGGLSNICPPSFSVRDFYLNGGSQAIMVRLFSPVFATEVDRQAAFTAAETEAQTAADAIVAAADGAVGGAAVPQDVADAAQDAVAAASAPGDIAAQAAEAIASAAQAAVADAVDPADVAAAATAAVADTVSQSANEAAPITRARITLDTLTIEASSEGSWGNSLRARIDHDVTGAEAATLFNLAIQDTATGEVEVIRNVSVATDSARRIDHVLETESTLVRVSGALPGARPAENAAPAVGADPFGPASSSGVVEVASDGNDLSELDFLGSEANKLGIYAFEDADNLNLLCIPPITPTTDVTNGVWTAASSYCEQRRAFLLVDPPSSWTTKDLAVAGMATGVGTTSQNAALFFPRLRQANVLRNSQIETFVPCGAVAGVMARTDSVRGVWKAPAGLGAEVRGVAELSVPLTDAENGELNPLGLNCLRFLPPSGRVIWGSRTLQGDDRLASEWKYLPVRRTALFIEESLFRGLHWAVFEPNDEPLWGQIRLNVRSFMHTLFRQGAFQGTKPDQAYLVKCDSETTTQDDINRGVVNILVGFAPLKPAEFVVIKLQQLAGQAQA